MSGHKSGTRHPMSVRWFKVGSTWHAFRLTYRALSFCGDYEPPVLVVEKQGLAFPPLVAPRCPKCVLEPSPA